MSLLVDAEAEPLGAVAVVRVVHEVEHGHEGVAEPRRRVAARQHEGLGVGPLWPTQVIETRVEGAPAAVRGLELAAPQRLRLRREQACSLRQPRSKSSASSQSTGSDSRSAMDGWASSQGSKASSEAASQTLAATAPRADRRPRSWRSRVAARYGRRVVGAAGQRTRHPREDLARSHVAVRDEAPAAFSRRADLDGRVAAVRREPV